MIQDEFYSDVLSLIIQAHHKGLRLAEIAEQLHEIGWFTERLNSLPESYLLDPAGALPPSS